MSALVISHWPCYTVICLSHHHWQELLKSETQLSAGGAGCCHLAQFTSCNPTNEMCVWANLTWPVFRTQNSPPRDQLSECEPRHRTDVAKLTFDLYKNNPKDFIGCLNVKATLYGVYSVSYDLRCYAAKNMLKWVKESAKYLEPSDIFML